MTEKEIAALELFFKETPRLNKMGFFIACEKFLLNEVPNGAPNASQLIQSLRGMHELARAVFDNSCTTEELRAKAATILKENS